MNRKLLATLFTSLALTLTACGGGGSSSGGLGGVNVDPSGSFTGVKTAAKISNQNYDDFLIGILGTKNLQDISLRDESSTPSTDYIRDFTTIASTAIKLGTEGSSYQQRAVSVNDSLACNQGGTISRNGTIDDVTFLGNLVLRFNTCIQDGITLDGSMEIVIRSYNIALDQAESYTLETSNLSVSNATESYSSTAVYDVVEDFSAGTAILLINALNTANGVETLYENLRLESDSSGVLISGRMYTEADGYVDITTDTPLLYNFDASYPYTGGPILLAGDTSNIRITPIGDDTIRVELDLDGDNVYEESQTIDANGNVSVAAGGNSGSVNSEF